MFNDMFTNDIVSFEQLGPVLKANMGRAKQKGVFEHVQNVQIQIHPIHKQSLIQAFTLP